MMEQALMVAQLHLVVLSPPLVAPPAMALQVGLANPVAEEAATVPPVALAETVECTAVAEVLGLTLTTARLVVTAAHTAAAVVAAKELLAEPAELTVAMVVTVVTILAQAAPIKKRATPELRIPGRLIGMVYTPSQILVVVPACAPPAIKPPAVLEAAVMADMAAIADSKLV